MRRHRASAPPADSSSSSSDNDDAFSAFSSSKKSKRKQKKQQTPNKKTADVNINVNTDATTDATTNTVKDDKKDKNTHTHKDKNTHAHAHIHTPSTNTVKRHHGTSSARQAKMDALLLELENNKNQSNEAGHYGPSGNGGADGNGAGSSSSSRPPPDKRGSFVEEGEEHLTTNIFVGNLAPSVTEEALTDLFRQFGDLYSVKIMWPRTAEERARNRNTGFVCFMTRDDAQEAMDAFNEEEVLGRRMVLRWGKNVKKTVKRGTGGVPIPPIKKKANKKIIISHNNAYHDHDHDHYPLGTGTETEPDTETDPRKEIETSTHITTAAAADPNEIRLNDDTTSTLTSANQSQPPMSRHSSVTMVKHKLSTPDTHTPPYPIYDPINDGPNAIQVIPPTDLYRLRFITTVASFVAKDGSLLEKKLIERESSNPLFSFLVDDYDYNKTKTWEQMSDLEQEHMRERVFYRWRVFSFNQGDGFNSWRTDPFIMLYPKGRWWIPPLLNQEAAQREEELAKQKEDDILRKMKERRRISNKKDFKTGRQLEHAKFGNVPGAGKNDGGGGAKLNDWEKEKFQNLLKKKLCASRESICEAMSFCFDKSGAAVEIADYLKTSLLEDGPGISVDTRIARLFLLSDILFNSQQPGVRNAFRYRDAIEAMAPEVFTSFGKHGNGTAGRMTMNKLRQAVNGVLNAWTNWSVYNSIFIDELEMRFEGKEITKEPQLPSETEAIDDNSLSSSAIQEVTDSQEIPSNKFDVDVPKPNKRPRIDWRPADDEVPCSDDVDGENLEDDDLAGIKHREDLQKSMELDGEPLLDSDLDGEPLDDDDEIEDEVLEDFEIEQDNTLNT